MCPTSVLFRVTSPSKRGVLRCCAFFYNENKFTSIFFLLFLNFYYLSPCLEMQDVSVERGCVLESVAVPTSESRTTTCNLNCSHFHSPCATCQALDMHFLLSPTTCEVERNTQLLGHRASHPSQDHLMTDFQYFLSPCALVLITLEKTEKSLVWRNLATSASVSACHREASCGICLFRRTHGFVRREPGRMRRRENPAKHVGRDPSDCRHGAQDPVWGQARLPGGEYPAAPFCGLAQSTLPWPGAKMQKRVWALPLGADYPEGSIIQSVGHFTDTEALNKAAQEKQNPS